MKTNVLTLIITLVVGIILAGSLLVPVLNDATKTSDTFTNNGLYYVDSLGENESVTYSCDSNGAYVDGVAITGDYATGYSGGASIAYTENLVIRWGGTGSFALRGAYWAYTSGAEASITFNGNGTYTGNYGDTEINGTYSEFYGLVLSETDRVMTASTGHKYVNASSEINVSGLTNCTNIGSFIVFNVSGSITDGITIVGYNQTTGAELELTYTNVEVNKTEVAGYVDLYDVTSITFDVTDTNDKTDSVTYTVFTIPTKVTAELSEHLTPGQISLMGAIPVMVIVALLMAAVGAIALRRAD